MDKISGILPSSQRVSSVDMKNSHPVRPGTPSFGRPEGTSTLRGKRVPTTETAMAKHQNLMASREHRQAKMVSDLADQFFLLNKTEAPKDPIRDIDVNYNLDRDPVGLPKHSDFSEVGTASSSPVENQPKFEEVAAEAAEGIEQEYVPRGTYLDVSA